MNSSGQDDEGPSTSAKRSRSREGADDQPAPANGKVKNGKAARLASSDADGDTGGKASSKQGSTNKLKNGVLPTQVCSTHSSCTPQWHHVLEINRAFA
jgi:hypothetical protein